MASLTLQFKKRAFPGFSGCINVMWQQIQTAKNERKEHHVTFLDLANSYGSVPHELLWAEFDIFMIPMSTTK